MKKLLDKTHQLFSKQEAEQIANEMQESDPGWNYVVVHDPVGTGYSFVEVYDENNNFIDKL